VARGYIAHTLIGIAAAAILLLYAPHGFSWFVPLLAGLVLAIPLVLLTSSLKLGEALRARGWFLIPSEVCMLPILARTHQLVAAQAAREIDVHRLVLENDTVRGLHLALLSDTPAAPAVDRGHLAALLASVRRRDTAGFTTQDWTALLSDAESLKTLGV
jgi:membrane glycosyltransferase